MERVPTASAAPLRMLQTIAPPVDRAPCVVTSGQPSSSCWMSLRSVSRNQRLPREAHRRTSGVCDGDAGEKCLLWGRLPDVHSGHPEFGLNEMPRAKSSHRRVDLVFLGPPAIVKGGVIAIAAEVTNRVPLCGLNHHEEFGLPLLALRKAWQGTIG